MFYKENDLKSALRAMASMIEKSEKAQGKFSPGTSHYTLLTNRIGALKTASLLIEAETAGNSAVLENDNLKNAIAPIESLISKSEKAREKLAQGTWQHTMTSGNIEALKIALPLLKRAAGEEQQEWP